MKKLYYFFDMDYEDVIHPPGLPFRSLLESVAYVGMHWHPDIEIILVLKGSVTLTNSQGLHVLTKGDVMLINSNEMHSYVENAENILLVLQTDPSVFRNIHSRNPDIHLNWDAGRFSKEEMDTVRRLLVRIHMEYRNKEAEYELFCRSLLYRLAGTVRRRVRESETEEAREDHTLRQTRIKKTMEYFNACYPEKIRLSDAAARLEISPHYLSHIMKEGTGRSFQENLNILRTGHAVNMMMHSSRNLLEISIACGFSDPKYFNSYFKRLFGMTPKEMKRQPDWKEAVLTHFQNQGLPLEAGQPELNEYLQ
ncbi:MAG: AraC family transcriptional regulator [Spirochaetales bacterium]|nr:AraC family transcriptional regulator [Spirochaetales bacterium]